MAAATESIVLNGSTTRPISTSKVDVLSQKRKRDDEDVVRPAESSARIEQVQHDLLQILTPLDSSPSLLNYSHFQLNANDSPTKKVRIADDNDKKMGTLSSRLRAASYTSIEEVEADLFATSEKLVDALRKVNKKEMDGERTNVHELKQVQSVQRFARAAQGIIRNETLLRSLSSGQSTGTRSRLNGEPPKDSAPAQRLNSVLTLFGNAPTPKQLFSSMQAATIVRSSERAPLPLAVEELGLPIGLTVTSVVPVADQRPSSETTFADAFPTPRNVPALLPPKPQRRPSTREGVITWEFRDPFGRSYRKGGWTVQGMTSGSWLNYGGPDPDRTGSSSQERRKQRDRALSGSEGINGKIDSDLSTDIILQAEAALARRAYSSFAPAHDDSLAILPTEAKRQLWWEKIGAPQFEHVFALDPALVDPLVAAEAQYTDKKADSEIELDPILEALDGSGQLDADLLASRNENAPEEILKRVSQLLETLSSYQTNRHATTAVSGPSAKGAVASASSIMAKIGQPHTPSEEENLLYQKVKHELAHLILQLPPYAVAKLNGDQLDELGVKALISFMVPDIRGTLEEDAASRAAKYAASAAAASINTTHHRTSSSAGQHYNTTAQRTPAIGQAANTRYGQQYNAARTPSHQYQRTSSQGHHSVPSTAARPGYGHSIQPGRPGVTPQYTQQYSSPRTQSYGGQSSYTSSQQHGLPNTKPNYALTQSVSQYQQRGQTGTPPNGVAYQTNLTPLQRSSTPVKPGDYARTPLLSRSGLSQNSPVTASYSSPVSTPLNGTGPVPSHKQEVPPPRNLVQSTTNGYKP